MLLDRRRSQEREGGAVPSSPSRGPVRSMPRLKLARGVSVRFSPTLASLDRAFPFCSPSLTERAEGGAEKPWKGGGVRSNCCEGGYAVPIRRPSQVADHHLALPPSSARARVPFSLTSLTRT